eukprot:c10715_g1_i1.p1 GENE.c10715_g1_i1~~c10715_g1_i1.p1  ORF type:complete len:238 (-),score=43.10 c10715_g1_i1:94-807(-)
MSDLRVAQARREAKELVSRLTALAGNLQGDSAGEVSQELKAIQDVYEQLMCELWTLKASNNDPVPSTNASGSVSGVLLKRSRVGGHWKARHFRLDETELVYGVFTSQQPISRVISKIIADPTTANRQSFSHNTTHSTSSSPTFQILGRINFQATWSAFDQPSSHGPLGYVFELHNPVKGERCYLFDCSSAEVRALWISALRKRIYVMELRLDPTRVLRPPLLNVQPFDHRQRTNEHI